MQYLSAKLREIEQFSIALERINTETRADAEKLRTNLEKSSDLLAGVTTGAQPDVGGVDWYAARNAQLAANRDALAKTHQAP